MKPKVILKHPIGYLPAPKFVLGQDAVFNLPFKPPQRIQTSYAVFEADGTLIVKRGYLWEANFPAMNTASTRPASLVHDCGYDLIKDGYLARDPYRELFDDAMRDVLNECDVSSFRAFAWWKAVRIGGDAALDAPRPSLIHSPPDPLPEVGWQAKSILGGK